jgi:hypothetical protein
MLTDYEVEKILRDELERTRKSVQQSLGWSPGLRQTVKTLLTVRCKFIVADPGTDLGWACR